MDWANERFVRLFTRDTPEWLCWVWQARALWPHLIRKADRSGVIANKLGARGLAALVGLPVDVVEAGLPDLLADGCLQVHQLGYVIPNYLEAQETPQSDKQRQRESRERRRSLVSAGLREDQRCEVVYFIRAASGGPIKIGHTDDVAARLASMQSSHPDALVLLATQPGDRSAEKRMHDRFARLRTRGEWFSPGRELLEYIGQLSGVTERDASRAVTIGHSGPDLAEPDPDQTESLPPARDPAVPAPEPTPAPAPAIGALVVTQAELAVELETRAASVLAASPPAPAREDIAGTHEADRPVRTENGQNRPVRPSDEVEKPATLVGDRDVKPSNLIPPGESAWHRRARWWTAMLDADQRIRAAGIEPNAPALPKNFAGENERNLARCERQLVDSGYAPDEVDAKMLHIVLVAEAEALRPDNRSRKWFKPALIWDPERANRAVDTTLEEARRPRAPAPRRGDPLPPAPPRPRPEPRKPDPVITDEDRAAMTALAAAAATAPERGREIASMPTAELVKRFGDGQRAPPASVLPDDDPPDDKQHRRRKAAT